MNDFEIHICIYEVLDVLHDTAIGNFISAMMADQSLFQNINKSVNILSYIFDLDHSFIFHANGSPPGLREIERGRNTSIFIHISMNNPNPMFREQEFHKSLSGAFLVSESSRAIIDDGDEHVAPWRIRRDSPRMGMPKNVVYVSFRMTELNPSL